MHHYYVGTLYTVPSQLDYIIDQIPSSLLYHQGTFSTALHIGEKKIAGT
jgi:hypothetical protein